MRMMVGRSPEVCRSRGLKVNAGKSKMMVPNGEEGLMCEVHVDGIRLEHVSKFKYLGCVLEESGRYEAECNRKVASGRRVAGAIRSLVNAKDLQLSVLESCMRHCLFLFLCMAVRPCYGGRSRDLELELYRWTAPENCRVLGGWIDLE